jgi:hypothetical protein
LHFFAKSFNEPTQVPSAHLKGEVCGHPFLFGQELVPFLTQVLPSETHLSNPAGHLKQALVLAAQLPSAQATVPFEQLGTTTVFVV